MKNKIRRSIDLLLGFLAITSISSCLNTKKEITFEQLNDSTTLVHIHKDAKYLLLPIEESSFENQVSLAGNPEGEVEMDIRLAKDSVDYFVPFALPPNSKEITLRIKRSEEEMLWQKQVTLSDTFDTTNKEKFRPIFHHTPLYGWMNDANGLIYKDGEYHLFYQYNPYGSMWGNMHWGHSVSRDLIHWQQLNPALSRDTLGHIFSGSTIIDKENVAGFGKNAMIAFYTSHSEKDGRQIQSQSIAYSNDNGRTFVKYNKNPILTSERKDFRDPKVFWYAPDKKWVMIVSADSEMQFFRSENLKDWSYMSSFGEGYGALPSQFECPDLIELPVDGNPDYKKWGLIVNINPGFPFGGSGTQYFTGEFNGKEFVADTKPEVVKWLDWGKDHYATVTFGNTEGRVIAVPWMSNWQYANIVPTKQFRSANALPRELSLYSQGNDFYLASIPVKETEALRKETISKGNMEVNRTYNIQSLLAHNEGAFEIEMTIIPKTNDEVGFELYNQKGEKCIISLDLKEQKIIVDRTQSGVVDFGKMSKPHPIENHDRRKTESINYINDFALATWAPIPMEKSYRLRVYVDKSSIEVFLNDGRIAMTNLIFPTEAYNSLRFFSDKGSAEVQNLTLYRLGL
ncbi:MAG: GH32 C-terminal domain-containing protein [Bacteroidales bacterium]